VLLVLENTVFFLSQTEAHKECRKSAGRSRALVFYLFMIEPNRFIVLSLSAEYNRGTLPWNDFLQNWRCVREHEGKGIPFQVECYQDIVKLKSLGFITDPILGSDLWITYRLPSRPAPQLSTTNSVLVSTSAENSILKIEVCGFRLWGVAAR